jgi:broad specificity phosphatase PhoE
MDQWEHAMRIHLVRHGESELNAGVTDIVDCGLTELGRRQCEAAGRFLAQSGLTRVLTSPYRRCLETAQSLASATGAPIEALPLLHEHHHDPFPPGAWPLPAKGDLVRVWPDVEFPAEMSESRWATVPEDREAQWKRMSQVVRSILARFATAPDAKVAVVTHQAPASAFVQAFCQWTNPLDVRVHIDVASVTTMEVDDDGRRNLVRLNLHPGAE